MKPFDLKKALAGHPLVTRDGRKPTNFKDSGVERRYWCDHGRVTRIVHYHDGVCPGIPEWDLSLADPKPTKPRLKSETRKNVERIRAIMGRQWMKLTEIQHLLVVRFEVYLPEQSVGTRVRDLRKDQYGGYDVRRKLVGKGLYAYKNFGKKGVKA